MRAAVLTSPDPTLELVDLDDPEPGPGEALLEVTGCGICGSDLHVASAFAPPGSVLGHEIAGVVRAVGPEVDADRWKPGTPVAARPLTGRGACRHCQRGRPDHCELFALPGTITGDDQALVEPLAVARRALRRAGLQEGEDVAVLGAGPIGLAIVAWARALGAGRILASEPSASRRELAQTLGADVTVDPTTAPVMASAAEQGFEQPPVVVECTGRPGLIGEAIGVADVEGRVCVVGVCTQPETFIPYFGLAKELDVRFSIYYGSEDFTDTIDALDAGTLAPHAMVTETIGLDRLPERFASLAHEPDGGKVILKPRPPSPKTRSTRGAHRRHQPPAPAAAPALAVPRRAVGVRLRPGRHRRRPVGGDLRPDHHRPLRP